MAVARLERELARDAQRPRERTEPLAELRRPRGEVAVTLGCEGSHALCATSLRTSGGSAASTALRSVARIIRLIDSASDTSRSQARRDGFPSLSGGPTRQNSILPVFLPRASYSRHLGERYQDDGYA